MKNIYIILILVAATLKINAQVVSINDITLGGISTSTFQETPIDADDNYSYSQSIYLQSEINVAGTISKITYYTDGVLENSNDITVYMAEKTEDVFSSNDDWLPFSSLTEVFSGTYEVYGNEVSIILDTPFNYSNTSNLVIIVDENQDDSDSNDFITHNLGFSEANGRVLHYGNNFTNPDPMSPPSGTRDYYRPNIEIDFNEITCFPPSNIAIGTIEPTALTISWESPVTNWDYVIQFAGLGNPDAATPVEASSSTINPQGLTSNTAYEFFVRSSCDTDDTSDWIGPINFRTGCETVNDFSESFESLPDELAIPYCWSVISTSTGTEASYKVNSSASQSYSPDNYYEIQINEDDELFVISPQSLTIADGTKRIEFAAKVNSTTSGETTLNVGLMTDPNSETTFEALSSFTLNSSSNNNNNYTLYYVNIPENINADYLAFNIETTSTFNKIVSIDDIVITSQPSCFEVLNLEASEITDTSFNLTLEADIQPQTQWELVVVQTDLNFNPDLETPIVVNTLTTPITTDSDGGSILPNSPYRVFIRANCDAAGSDGSGYSSWFGPYDLRTDCAPLNNGFTETFESYSNADFPFCWSKNITSTGSPLVQVSSFASYANSGSNSLIMNTGNDPNANILLILPQSTIANDGNHRLEYYARKTNVNTDINLIVGTMSDPLDANTFEEITAVPVLTGGTSGENVQYFVNLPFNDNDYVVLKHGAGDAASVALYLDDVTITEQPDCTEVFNVTANNVTASSVSVSWEFIGDQTQWEYIVQPLNTGIPVSGQSTMSNTSNSDFSMLDANTSYEIYVRANCDTDGYSDWSAPITFTTLCVGESDNFTHSFEGFESNTPIEPCWSSLITPFSTSPTITYSSTQAQDGSLSARLYSGNSTDTDLLLISPQVLDLDATKQISFYVYDNDMGALEVGTMANKNDATTFTPYQVFTDADLTDDAWEQKIVTFEDYTGTDQYIAFRYVAASTFDNLFIDNFSYDTNPVLSTSENSLSDVSIYPNPVKNALHITGEHISSITIYTINGKKVFSKRESLETINVTNLNAGIYFVELKDQDGKRIMKKVIKQ